MPASPWLASSSGLITGGALAILADIAFGLSIETELPAAHAVHDRRAVALLPAPGASAATLLAGGQAIHVGRSVGLSEVFVIDEEADRLIAHGTSRLTDLSAAGAGARPARDHRAVRRAARTSPRTHTCVRRRAG